MLDEKGFRQFLRRAGKKEHVVEGLVRPVQAFESYLASEGRSRLEAAAAKDMLDYAQTLTPREGKVRMRGVALYYRFAGNEALARLAGDIREQETAKSRKVFRLRDFRGVSPEDAARLEALGIVTVEHMLAAGKTPQARQQLAEQTGISPQAVLELVKLSDLSRMR